MDLASFEFLLFYHPSPTTLLFSSRTRQYDSVRDGKSVLPPAENPTRRVVLNVSPTLPRPGLRSSLLAFFPLLPETSRLTSTVSHQAPLPLALGLFIGLPQVPSVTLRLSVFYSNSSFCERPSFEASSLLCLLPGSNTCQLLTLHGDSH